MLRWRPTRLVRLLLAPLAAFGLAVFVWLSVQVYLSKTDPESYRAWDGPYAWIIGPPAAELEEAARAHIQAGREVLNDTSLPPAQRIGRFRERLERAEALLVRSLRAQPAQARALAALAAVRWELDPPLTPDAVETHLEMIALASRMAPNYPDVQKRLGKLLLSMGRQAEAIDYLSRAVELDPKLSREVIALLRDHLLTANQMLDALPKHATVLVHLERPFRDESKQAEYLALLEDALTKEIDPALLLRYGSTCLRQREFARLLRYMDELGSLTDVAAEAERLTQRSRALVALGRAQLALEDARQARTLQPTVFRRAEQLGDVALSAQNQALAVGAYRDALGILARTTGNAKYRARLYRKIGEAQERGARPDLAYDAYRKAVELNPDELRASKRLTEMERAAGFD